MIVDTVTYKGLIPGQEYTVKGTLMDKSTGKELLVDEKPVTAEKKFTPEKSNGSVDLEFAFDSTLLKGETVVVFEKLYAGNTEVASHEDINDEAQAVKIQEKEKGKITTSMPGKTGGGSSSTRRGTVKTGDDSPLAALILLAVVSGTAVVVAARRKKKSEGKAEK